MSLPRPLADALWALQFRFNNRFRRRLAVLRCEATAAAAAETDGKGGVTVDAYGPGDVLPDDVARGLTERFGADFPAVQRAEAADGATLWVGSIPGEHGGEPLGFARTRPGDRAPGWHEALGPDDRLVYAMATQRAARGRGVSTAVLRAALAAVPPGGAAWADTMVWNAPALAVLRRVGFKDLYEAAPLPDHPD